MELLHCEKLRKQKELLEKADLDVVSANKTGRGVKRRYCLFVFDVSVPLVHTFQGEYEFSPEILRGKLAEVVYRDATDKIKGKLSETIVMKVPESVGCTATTEQQKLV